ncbi:MAG: DNA internalization-related competence protein ComEC/Rec2 [Clostridiales bacterium]|jgi:competence protein ComEC|nr:DNA internalization-related competence protein ComEC/Rec2 [Clostridiales bacterium]
MKRPIVYIAAFFAAGAIAGRLGADWAVGAAVAAFALSSAFFGKWRIYAVLLLPVVTALGAATVTVSLRRDPAVMALAGADGEATGIIVESGETEGGYGRLLMSLTDAGGSPARGDVLVYIDPEISRRLIPGDRVRAFGELAMPDAPRNPGGYDEERYFAVQGISLKMYADGAERLARPAFSARAALGALRARLAAIFDGSLPKLESGIMKAMIIGDRTGLEPVTEDLFQKAGIYHILAISGLHVSILAGAITRFLKGALGKRRGAVSAIAFLAFYCALTGAGNATVRAVVMASAGLFGDVIGRRGDSLSNVSLAALLILIFRPLAVWTPGFQYSFGAVYALILVSPAVSRALSAMTRRLGLPEPGRALGFIRDDFVSSLTVTAATAPVMAAHFWFVSPVGVILNMIVIPTVPVAVGAGFLMCLFGMILPGAERLVAPACQLPLWMYHALCFVGLKLPGAYIVTGKPPPAAVVSFMAMIAVFAWAAGRKKIRRRHASVTAALAVCFAAVCVFWRTAPPEFSVTMLDVGQGDATVVMYGREAVLIDGGGDARDIIGESTGRRTVAPFLKYMGVSELSAAFVSHPDADHAVGVIESVEMMGARVVYVSSAADARGTYQDEIRRAAESSGAAVVPLSAGDEVTLIAGAVARVVWPPPGETIPGNDASLVFRLTYGQADFLFTGDVSASVERKLPAADISECEVLKVAHHGSKYSSSEDFLAVVSPDLALIGAGRGNSFGHPAPETLERLEAAGAAVFVTAQRGAVTLTVRDGRIFVENMIKKI